MIYILFGSWKRKLLPQKFYRQPFSIKMLVFSWVVTFNRQRKLQPQLGEKIRTEPQPQDNFLTPKIVLVRYNYSKLLEKAGYVVCGPISKFVIYLYFSRQTQRVVNFITKFFRDKKYCCVCFHRCFPSFWQSEAWQLNI